MPLTKIAAKERVVTGTGLVGISMIAATIWWTYQAVGTANLEREQVSAIARELSTLRLVTFEYRLYRIERVRVQWFTVADHVDAVIANTEKSMPSQNKILAGMRENVAKARRLFTELTMTVTESGPDTSLDDPTRLFAAQLISQLLTDQQSVFADVFRLIGIANQRINDAQQRMLMVTLAGLMLIAAIVMSASWFLRRSVLVPIVKLQQATQQIAAGNWDTHLDINRNDEIGELSKRFDTMTSALHASFAQLERSNRDLALLNQELETFSYSVSHDLRAPLRSMDGFSQMLLEDYGGKLDEDGKDALQRIRAASQRMGDLIDDLLRLSQVTRAGLNIKRIDLSAIAREIADNLEREQPGRTVAWEIEPGLSVHADPALMRIAMQNLLQNARKFTGRTERPVIRVGALERDAAKMYFVADNGVGFDMAHADKLFGAFQRLHHTGDFPGTGIGLTIVQRIIHRHGGAIRAEAKEGQGATFFFNIKEVENGSGEQDYPAG